jgi:hypothetical protein
VVLLFTFRNGFAALFAEKLRFSDLCFSRSGGYAAAQCLIPIQFLLNKP